MLVSVLLCSSMSLEFLFGATAQQLIMLELTCHCNTTTAWCDEWRRNNKKQCMWTRDNDEDQRSHNNNDWAHSKVKQFAVTESTCVKHRWEHFLDHSSQNLRCILSSQFSPCGSIVSWRSDIQSSNFSGCLAPSLRGKQCLDHKHPQPNHSAVSDMRGKGWNSRPRKHPPRGLGRLLFQSIPMCSAAVCKGWLEERKVVWKTHFEEETCQKILMAKKFLLANLGWVQSYIYYSSCVKTFPTAKGDS